MKFLSVMIFIGLSILTYSQGTYNVTSDGKVSNFYKKVEFNNFCKVDYDFNKTSNCVAATTSFIIDVKTDGTGQFLLYYENKTSYKIISCVKKENCFLMSLENENGYKFTAALFVKNNVIENFYFVNTNDNTGYMLY